MAKMMMQTAYTDVEMEVNPGVARQLLQFAEGHPQTRVLSRTDGDGVDAAELRSLVAALRNENQRLVEQHVTMRRERDAAKGIIEELLNAVSIDQAAKVHPGSILREVSKSLRAYVKNGSQVGYATGMSGARIATQRRRRRQAEQAAAIADAATASVASIADSFEHLTFTTTDWQRSIRDAFEQAGRAGANDIRVFGDGHVRSSAGTHNTWSMPRWFDNHREVQS